MSQFLNCGKYWYVNAGKLSRNLIIVFMSNADFRISSKFSGLRYMN